MASATYRTDLRCGACVAAIQPLLDQESGVESWSADVTRPDKPLTVVGNASRARVSEILHKAGGYHVLGEIALPTAMPADEPKPSYFPLLLILAYLLAVIFVIEWRNQPIHGMRAMRHFMAGFFLVFSFFKLLDLRGFAASYGNYDLLARAMPLYAWAYPFLELALGLAYAANLWPTGTNIVTLALMMVGTIGVTKTIFEGRRVKCACLGSVIQLPVATATFIEDAGMAAMAAVMLLQP